MAISSVAVMTMSLSARFLLFLLIYGCSDSNSEAPKVETSESETDTFSENLAKLEFPKSLELKEVVVGNEDAPLTVIIYSSFTCDHCSNFHLKEFPKFKKK
ncbi:MAG: DsbA family protein, partial [Holosporaceae bacterium]|nr:DsbA family protein [Holosporaceae bacterium]